MEMNVQRIGIAVVSETDNASTSSEEIAIESGQLETGKARL